MGAMELTTAGKSVGSVAAIIVAQGRVLDFIDGHTQRRETPEEYVRQEVCKSLVREYAYPKADLEVEYTIRVGTRKPRADVVIFTPGQPHTKEHVRIIVECKAKEVRASDKKEGIGQLLSYLDACPNVMYGLWTNGNGGERECFRCVVRDGIKVNEPVADVPEAGLDEAAEADRPRFDRLKPATSDALLFAFRRCHNYIAGNQGLQKSQAFWELLKLIFCKIHDERHNDRVEFFVGPNERHSVGGEVKVVRRIETLFTTVKADFPTIFTDADAIGLNPDVLAYLVSQLQRYSLLDSDIDVKGRAYEEIVGSNLRGDRGEFFTPRNVCRMAVEMLDPGEGQLILDPACGTGGFLITAMNHVIGKVQSAERAKGGAVARIRQASEARVRQFAERRIVGIDFNPELVKASKMNMVMNNDGAGGLFQGNSLARPVTWDEGLRKANLMGRVDLLFTNPPFGLRIPVSDPKILEQYELAHTWTYDKAADKWRRGDSLQKSQSPELLFIERCVQFLKPGSGRAAIVLPDGVLGSPSLGYVRQWIMENTRVLASVDLHPDTFEPFVNIQTSLLVVERKESTLIDVERAANRMNDYDVFMAVADHFGHDKRGNVTYVRDEHGNEVVVTEEDVAVDRQSQGTVVRHLSSQHKVVDDNTLQIAQEFRRWLSANA